MSNPTSGANERSRRPRARGTDTLAPVPLRPRATNNTVETEGALINRLPIAALAMGAVIDLLALGLVSIGGGRPLPTLTALAFHMVAVGTAAMNNHLQGSRRMLAFCLVLCLPSAGAPLALLVLGTRSAAGSAEVMPSDDEELLTPDPEHIRRIADAPPACEALLASGGEDRQTILAALIRRKDADAVELLRWLAAGNQELAVDAALALEELSVGFESDLEQYRALVRDDPSPDAALAAGRCICDAIEAGIVDSVMMGSLATEARRYFEQTCPLVEPASVHEVTASWARLEIAAMRPEVAFALLNRALEVTGDDNAPGELIALREEARFASHGLLSYELHLDQSTPTNARPRSTGRNLVIC